MGVFKGFSDSARGLMADQWKEYIFCKSIPDGFLMVRGERRVSGNSANIKGNSDVISNRSIIAVADGQTAILVSNGRIAALFMEPGEHLLENGTPTTFDQSRQNEAGSELLQRFSFGGEAPPATQKVYYLNTREIAGTPFSSRGAVPIQLVHAETGTAFTCSVKCRGTFSFRIISPDIAYQNWIGLSSAGYTKAVLCQQLESELLTVLQTAAGKLSIHALSAHSLPTIIPQLEQAIKEEFQHRMEEARGISLCSISFSEFSLLPADLQTLQEFQQDLRLRDPELAAAHLAAAQTAAMQAAAASLRGECSPSTSPESAPAPSGGQAQDPASPVWTCQCGAVSHSNFCGSCGAKRPKLWLCSCGQQNIGKFCSECGKRQPLLSQYR